MTGIEPACPAWKAGALTVVLHPLTINEKYWILEKYSRF